MCASYSCRYFQPTFDALGPGGRHVVYGAADLTPHGDAVWSLLNPMVGLKLAYKWLTRPKVSNQKPEDRERRYLKSQVIIK